MALRQREIVLIPVPFTDLTTTKRRPVLLLSSTSWNAQSPDIIVAAMTSNLNASISGIVIDGQDLEEGVLPQRSLVRADKIYTLSQAIMIRSFGLLSRQAFGRVLAALDTVLDRSPGNP